jgi:hypothetical protein
MDVLRTLGYLYRRFSGASVPVCTAAAALSVTMPLKARTPEEQAVLAPIQAFFDGIAKRDKAVMLEVVLPEGGVTIIRNGRRLL